MGFVGWTNQMHNLWDTDKRHCQLEDQWLMGLILGLQGPPGCCRVSLCSSTPWLFGHMFPFFPWSSLHSTLSVPLGSFPIFPSPFFLSPVLYVISVVRISSCAGIHFFFLHLSVFTAIFVLYSTEDDLYLHVQWGSRGEERPLGSNGRNSVAPESGSKHLD